jgi:hypothetical protein
MSLLMNQSFKTVQELNRYRKDLSREIAASVAPAPVATGA